MFWTGGKISPILLQITAIVILWRPILDVWLSKIQTEQDTEKCHVGILGIIFAQMSLDFQKISVWSNLQSLSSSDLLTCVTHPCTAQPPISIGVFNTPSMCAIICWWLAWWTANREVEVSAPYQGRKLYSDNDFGSNFGGPPQPTEPTIQWRVRWPDDEKQNWHHTPSLRKLKSLSFLAHGFISRLVSGTFYSVVGLIYNLHSLF